MAINEKNEALKNEEAAAAAAVAEAAASTVEEAEDDISDEIVTSLKVERESFKMSDGDKGEKECFDYFIRAVFHKKAGPVEVKIHLVPKDVGGFALLDLLFDMSDEDLQFRLKPWVIKAEKKGEKDSTGVTYVIASPAAPKEMRLKVKPAKDSDVSALRMFLFVNGFSV